MVTAQIEGSGKAGLALLTVHRSLVSLTVSLREQLEALEEEEELPMVERFWEPWFPSGGGSDFAYGRLVDPAALSCGDVLALYFKGWQYTVAKLNEGHGIWRAAGFPEGLTLLDTRETTWPTVQGRDFVVRYEPQSGIPWPDQIRGLSP